MIKISKICDKNKKKFYDDVKKSYLKLLNKIKKNEKKIYNIENRNKIIDYFYEDDKICENKVIEVITGDRKVLEKVIKEIGVLEKNKDDKKLHDEFESIYNNFTNREFGRTWGKKIGVEICPYCNRSFIYTTPKKGTRPQYDHYYPKSKYPYLALSMYNLIPCCPVCNNAKNAEDTFDNKSLLYPFEEEYGYDIFFEIETDEQLCYLGLSNDFNIKIKSKENVEEDLKQKVQNSSKILHIEELYNLHNDYVSKLLRSKYIFTDEYCQSLLDTYPDWFFDMNEVKNQLYFNSLQKEEWGDQILSKLTYDILNSE